MQGATALAGAGVAVSLLPKVSLASASADVLNSPKVAAWYEGAKVEGEVNYYASNNPALSQRMAVGFNARYPEVKVNIVRLASGPLGKRYATEAEAGNFVADILQQDIRWVPSTVPGTQMLAAGEAALLLQNLRMVSYSVIESGGPIDDVMLEPNTGLESTAAISTEASHPNAARLLLNYVLSPEGQALLAKDVGASPLGDIPGALPLPNDYRPGTYEAIQEGLAQSDRFIKLVGLD
jgi:ABC-type glycerol-3-phosphate transport system substrate-binding protein